MPADNRVRCYVASPLGFTEAGRHYYREILLPALAAVIEPVDPWSLTTDADIATARRHGQARALALEIGRRNISAIRSASLLAAVLEGQELDAGTAAELGYAAALGKPCFGVRSDLRQTGEEGVSVNLQVEALVVESGGRIVATLAELVETLREGAARLSE
jgi:nucleoside 2-deoxyribosyltransferase